MCDLMGASPSVHIEPLEPSDVVAVAQCIALDATAFPHESIPLLTNVRSARVWVARLSGESAVVGFLGVHCRNRAMYISGLAVDPRFRRRGVGRALLRAAIDQASRGDMREMTLNTAVGNRAAMALYESEGFAIRRRLPAFYARAAVDGGPDAYEMVRLVAHAT